MISLLLERPRVKAHPLPQTRELSRPLTHQIAGWAQVALFAWMACWGGYSLPKQSTIDPEVEYVAVGTARIDYSKRSPERSDGRDERERASQFLELVTTINGVRNWHVTGPDLDGRYGGLNGCGGVEAIYNQSTSSATYLLSDTYGHTEGTLSGTTFVWNPTQCDGYGALPGTTKPSALVAGANVASQLGWRGHYIDPTGFYYMGARNYAPDSGTFLSPDPLGHSASMDLYSYCDGDPVNQYDADGRLSAGFNSGLNGNISANAPTSSAFYIGNLIGGGVSGAGTGIQNGAGGEVSVFTLGKVQGAFGSDPLSSEYAMGRAGGYAAAIPALGAATLASGGAIAPVLFEGGAGIAGTMTEAGFVSAVPQGGTGLLNLASIAARQTTAQLLAPGGVAVSTIGLANSEKAKSALEFTLASFDLIPPSPYSSKYEAAGDVVNKSFIDPLKKAISK